MANSFFRFKQFTINQDACAMKVTTDGCIFGAVAANEVAEVNCQRILDIGTGTGLLSLMLAQKNHSAKITAIEIDTAAARQAVENINGAEFADRITVINGDINKFKSASPFEFIICNPPFYENELKGPNAIKNKAHHEDTLTLIQLLTAIDDLSSDVTSLCILLPYYRAGNFIETASQFKWNCYKQLTIMQTEKHNPFRSIMFFNRKISAISKDELIIKKHNVYSEKFISLLKDYYLYL